MRHVDQCRSVRRPASSHDPEPDGGVDGKRMPDFESVKALTVTFGQTSKGGTVPLVGS